ncbi:alpha/beta hydrolase [Salibacteraceae bacterium]|jgi:pimeloyl-ACP methyl ester carboxylesterase|nr:alpha/beta hydrolase [Salibacteraceae bacterium]MDB0058211.1 alpha/beta hydrolase [Salibacteraceae bacterium]MDB9725244.1 alpha/beta hydrolase [Salibacteraceae bacterium]MDC1204909.1 alpha/beta hydrolase [Salibacteraceae bacterium]
MPFSRYKKAKIYFTEIGKGSTVILLHGFLETSLMWKDFLPSLSQKHRVLCIDLPGHGQSECFGYTHSMDDMAGCVLAVLKTLRIRKAKLIGHSMGGYVALAFADLYPDYTKGICLFFSTSRADSVQKKKDRSRAISVVKENHTSFIRVAIPLLFRSKFRKLKKEAIKSVKEEALKTSKQGVIAALEGMKRRPSREILLKFPPYPIHIVSGKKDPIIPVSTMEKQMNRSENVSGIILNKPGHMGHIEAPEECLRELMWFIKK